MQIHQLKRKNKNKKSIQVGRGGTRGKTSGRGTKGQNARAGRKKRPELRDIIKKIPKLRGRGKNSFVSFYGKPITLNVSHLDAAFKAGEKVTPGTLVLKEVVKMYKGKNPEIKILSNGEITKKVIISGCTVSAGAKEKIEKAGGQIKP